MGLGWCRLLLWGLLLLASCERSSQGNSAPLDAGGCSDWPVRPGETFVSLDGASRFEVEPHFVTRQGEVAIAWEASGCDDRTRIGYTRTGNTGLRKPTYLESPNRQQASNVTLAFDGAMSLFASWASWTPGPDPAHPATQPSDIRIQFARWPAGADGFQAPVELSEPIADQLYDKPWLIVTADDVIVVTYSDLRQGGIWAASSADAGASFRRVRIDSAMANLAASCPDGRPGGAFVTYFGSGIIRLAHTADGGATWSAPQTVATIDLSGDVAYHDPTCVAAGDDVWVAYGRTHDDFSVPLERLLSVHVVHTTLGTTAPAATATALVAADNTVDGGPATAFLLTPQLARKPDGSLAVAAYRAADQIEGSAELVVAASSDGGHTFAMPTTLATGLTATLQRHVPAWLGDYFGWATTETGLAVAFVDNASGFSHIVFADLVGR